MNKLVRHQAGYYTYVGSDGLQYHVRQLRKELWRVVVKCRHCSDIDRVYGHTTLTGCRNWLENR